MWWNRSTGEECAKVVQSGVTIKWSQWENDNNKPLTISKIS